MLRASQDILLMHITEPHCCSPFLNININIKTASDLQQFSKKNSLLGLFNFRFNILSERERES